MQRRSSSGNAASSCASSPRKAATIAASPPAARSASASSTHAGGDPATEERALQAMIALGRDHFNAFAAEAASLPQSLRPAFLPAALAPGYLDGVARQGSRALSETFSLSALRRHWTLFRTAMKGW